MAALPRDGSVTLLDARTPQEYAKGNAEGFVNIPVDELRARLGELEAGKPVYVMCQSGLRSYIACRILAQNGFECYNFSGGYRFSPEHPRSPVCGKRPHVLAGRNQSIRRNERCLS